MKRNVKQPTRLRLQQKLMAFASQQKQISNKTKQQQKKNLIDMYFTIQGINQHSNTTKTPPKGKREIQEYCCCCWFFSCIIWFYALACSFKSIRLRLKMKILWIYLFKCLLLYFWKNHVYIPIFYKKTIDHIKYSTFFLFSRYGFKTAERNGANRKKLDQRVIPTTPICRVEPRFHRLRFPHLCHQIHFHI